jgi:DMSO/TMAO reductase YedYZ molybdopterin-dependent catalytic subunit
VTPRAIGEHPAPTEGPLTREELALATRNRGMPLEALRYDVTPTGLHYLLVHYDIPDVNPADWLLRVGGSVSQPMSLSLDDVRAMSATSLTVTMECAGNGRVRLNPRPISQPWGLEAIGTATWTGVPLARVLQKADVLPETREIVFTGADHGIEKGIEQDYQRSLSIEQAMRPEVLLAYEMNGEPLPPQHGFPLRLVVPGWYGMASVKWLASIEAVTRPFDGYQQAQSYAYRSDPDDAGEPVTRIRIRSLIIPPGFPDFFTRRRILDAGRVTVRGRTWSGAAPVARVEFGVDDAWIDATLDEPLGQFAWRGWSAQWEATPGEHVLACRATDERGEVQPLEAPWNYGGYGNNLVQRVDVTVR